MAETAAALQAEAPNLATVLTLTPPNGALPLLAATFTFFFRREIETKPEVYRGLSFDMLRTSLDTLRGLTALQDAGFARLERTLQDRSEGILGQVDAMFEVLDRGFTGVGGKLEDITTDCNRFEASPRRCGPFLVPSKSVREYAGDKYHGVHESLSI